MQFTLAPLVAKLMRREIDLTNSGCKELTKSSFEILCWFVVKTLIFLNTRGIDIAHAWYNINTITYCTSL